MQSCWGRRRFPTGEISPLGVIPPCKKTHYTKVVWISRWACHRMVKQVDEQMTGSVTQQPFSYRKSSTFSCRQSSAHPCRWQQLAQPQIPPTSLTKIRAHRSETLVYGCAVSPLQCWYEPVVAWLSPDSYLQICPRVWSTHSRREWGQRLRAEPIALAVVSFVKGTCRCMQRYTDMRNLCA